MSDLRFPDVENHRKNAFFRSSGSRSRLRPLANEVGAERDADQTRMRPVEWIFDILSRGQYASANFVEDLFDSKGFGKALEGAAQGLTGKRKGDYEDVFFGETPEEDRVWWQKALGFAGNVLLDPTTWIGLGPTTKARAAAKAFADDAAKVVFRKSKNFDEVAAASQKGFDLEKAVGMSPGKMSRYFEKAGLEGNPADLVRRMDETWRESFRKGLRMNKDEMIEAMKKPLQEEHDLLSKGRDVWRGVRHLKTTPQAMVPDQLRVGEHLTDLRDRMDKLMDPALTVHLEKAGERAMRFMRKEFGRGVRRPNAVVRGGDWVRKAIKATPGGQKFTDAWWAVSNRGPVGAFRKVFGVKNAYQKMVNNVLLDSKDFLAHQLHRHLKIIDGAFKKLMPDDKQGFLKAMQRAEAQNISPTKLAADKRYLKLIAPNSDPDRIAQMLATEDELSKSWKEALKNAEGKEVDVYGILKAYFPLIRKKDLVGDTAGREYIYGASFTRPRGVSLEEAVKEQVAKVRMTYGVDDVTAHKLVEGHNMGDLLTDPRQALYMRANIQAKMEARVHLLRQFREFGIQIDQGRNLMQTNTVLGITEELDVHNFNRANFLRALEETGGLQKVGLTRVEEPALKGYLFDREVATVLTRLTKVTQNEESMQVVRKGLRYVNNMFKAVVTTSGGFHFRNHFSNQMTGFLKFGPRWFNPRKHYQAMVATELALGGIDGPGMKLIKLQVGGEAGLQKILESRVGGYTIRQWSELGHRNGVISTSSRVADAEDIDRLGRKAVKLANVLSPSHPLYKGSREVGSRVESVSRMQAFLLDVEDITKGQKIAANPHQIEWSKLEAKKWFMDYNDLTEAERSYMKGIIPFYTFMRKNVANQIMGIIEMPEMYSLIPKVQAAIEARDPDFDKELYPEWWLGAGVFPVGRSEEGTIVFRPNFPYQEGLNLFPIIADEDVPLFGIRPYWADWKDSMINSMNPLLKSLVELTSEDGYNTFYKEELPEHSAAPRALRVMTKSPRVLGLVDWIFRMGGIEGGLGLTLDDGSSNVDDRGRLQMNAKAARALDNHLPVLNRMGDWMDFPIWAGEKLGIPIEKAVTAISGARDNYDGVDEGMRILSGWFGVKLDVMDREQQELKRAYDIWNTMQELLSERPADPRRSLQAKNNQMRTFRRLGILPRSS